MIDPNLTYLLLLLGLWASVFGVYVPGTGFIELLAAGAADPAQFWRW